MTIRVVTCVGQSHAGQVLEHTECIRMICVDTIDYDFMYKASLILSSKSIFPSSTMLKLLTDGQTDRWTDQ